MVTTGDPDVFRSVATRVFGGDLSDIEAIDLDLASAEPARAD